MNIALTLTDFAAISPLLILLFAALLLLLIESFSTLPAKRLSTALTLIAIAIAFYAAIFAPASTNSLFTPWIRFDSLARFFTIFFLAIGFGSTLLSLSFFQDFEATLGDYFFLLVSALFGLILIGVAADFLTLFLGLETLSLSLYILCGYMKKWEISHEASIKYLLIGSLATAFLLYGISLIYGAVGSTHFDALLVDYQNVNTVSERALFLCGIALVTLGLAFKAAIVPFHAWAPDVYAGAPTPVTAFMAVGTKVGAFAAFVILFFRALPHFDPIWNQSMELLAYLTLIYANFVALRQTQLRRFFAYSGISHAGFLLIPLIVGNAEALTSLIFYLVVYALATMGSFAVLAFLDHRKEGVFIEDLYGLFRRSPFLAGLLTLCFLTLAGIPPTIGFFAKFYIFKVAFQAGYYGLVFVGLFTTLLSAFYYLRMIGVMFSEEITDVKRITLSWPAALIGAFSFVVILIISIYPVTLMDLLKMSHF